VVRNPACGGAVAPSVSATSYDGTQAAAPALTPWTPSGCGGGGGGGGPETDSGGAPPAPKLSAKLSGVGRRKQPALTVKATDASRKLSSLKIIFPKGLAVVRKRVFIGGSARAGAGGNP